MLLLKVVIYVASVNTTDISFDFNKFKSDPQFYKLRIKFILNISITDYLNPRDIQMPKY